MSLRLDTVQGWTQHRRLLMSSQWLEGRYPSAWAEEWDAVGLVSGRPNASVRRVLFAVDPVPEVVEEAIAAKADLIVTHHPLFLQGVHSVAATTWKGALVHDLINASVALYCAHTNADVAPGGVNDALAEALGLDNIKVISPSSSSEAALLGAGLGRWGTLKAPRSLDEFAQLVTEKLPTTSSGVRVAGNLAAEVARVGVCGGAGDSLLAQAEALELDVFVTADLRHHAVLESGLRSRLALIDPGHWASEWPWLPVAATRLVADAAAHGTTVEVLVSKQVTDPWVAR